MKINPEKLFNTVNITNTFKKKDGSSKNNKYKKLLEVLTIRKKLLSGAFKYSSLFGLFILLLAPIIFYFTKKRVTETVNTSEIPTPASLSNFLNSIIREPIRITSVYDSQRGGGRKHKGVDIQAQTWTRVYAPPLMATGFKYNVIFYIPWR